MTRRRKPLPDAPEARALAKALTPDWMALDEPLEGLPEATGSDIGNTYGQDDLQSHHPSPDAPERLQRKRHIVEVARKILLDFCQVIVL